jgi:nucleotide-binding universal stress UspA family protein
MPNVPSKILIATDFSVSAQRAVDLGATIAARLGAQVLVIHVYGLPVTVVPDTIVAITPGHLSDVLDRYARALAEVAEEVKRHGVTTVSTRLVEGTPWREIVGLAAAEACDLIVVGTHGHGGIVHFLVGSVAEKVVRTAGRPVLVAGGGPQ